MTPLPLSRPGPFRLVHMIDSLATGGAERLVVTFAEEVRRRPGVAFRVVTLSDDRTPFREELERMGVEVVALSGRSLADPRRFARIVAEIRGRTDYLHAHLVSSTILGGIASRLLSIPFAATAHNVRPSTRRMSLPKRRLHRLVMRGASVRRIAVGEAVAAANAEEANGRPFAVVPNAVPPSAVWRDGGREAIRRELGLERDALALIAVGVVIGQKGYPDLIEAFGRVAGRHPRATLLIAGAVAWPELKRELDARIAELGLGDRVRFLGLRRDVPRLLAASDLFVSASHWEGAPVSLLEAMANGLPCLVTDVGDNSRTLAGLPAPTPPAGDVDGFARSLDEMLADEAGRAALAEAARRRALEDFGPSAWVDRLFALYAEDLAACGRRGIDVEGLPCVSP